MKSIINIITVVFLFQSSHYSVHARIINIPDDHETIQAGIDASEDGDTVLVQPGEYVENIDFDGKQIILTGTYIFEDDPNLIEETIIDGDSDGSVVTFENEENDNAVLSGFTIQNGSGKLQVTENREFYFAGGGIFCSEANPTITNCIISDNSIDEYTTLGGGIYLYLSFSVITNCTINENSLRGNTGNGAGIYSIRSTPYIENCRIVDNRINSQYGSGGGINCYATDQAIITNCTINDNYAPRGGGLFCYDDVDIRIVGCTIRGNSSSRTGGGIQMIRSEGTISYCTIVGNSAALWGGGISIHQDNPTIEYSNIISNEAEFGGGITCHFDSDPIMRNCLISANTSEVRGGGMYCKSNSSPVLLNCTITGNESEYGGAVWCGNNSSPIYANSILWNNSPQEIYFWENDPPGMVSIFHSDLDGGEDDIVTNDNGFVEWGDGNIDEDPEFADPEELNFSLTAESPCIDTGDPEVELDPDGTRADMGAFYFHQRDIEVIPTNIEFPAIPWGELDSLPVNIINTGGTNLSIIEIVPANCQEHVYMELIDENDLPIVIEPTDTLTLQAYNRPDPRAMPECTALIVSDDPDEPEIVIEMSADVMSVDEDVCVPAFYELSTPFPNPFNSTVTLKYNLSNPVHTSIQIYVLSGRMIESLVNHQIPAGRHSVSWSAEGYPSGMYLVKMEAGEFRAITKVILTK